MAARAEKRGKARKSAEKNKKPSAPAKAPSQETRQPAWHIITNYQQL